MRGIGEAQQRHARLARPQELARPPDAQILTRDLEAVVVLVDHLEARLCGFGHRFLEQQDAGALRRAAADPAAKLVQLREPEAFGVLDDHQRRIGHIDTDFDHRRRDQHIDVSGRERAHGRILLVR